MDKKIPSYNDYLKGGRLYGKTAEGKLIEDFKMETDLIISQLKEIQFEIPWGRGFPIIPIAIKRINDLEDEIGNLKTALGEK